MQLNRLLVEHITAFVIFHDTLVLIFQWKASTVA
jgi:hypothetical protein